MIIKKTKCILSLLILALVLCGCEKAESIRVLYDSDEIHMAVGSAINIPAKATPENARISYRSSDASVVYYEDDLVYALSPGSSVIYARSDEVTSNFIVVHVHDFEQEEES